MNVCMLVGHQQAWVWRISPESHLSLFVELHITCRWVALSDLHRPMFAYYFLLCHPQEHYPERCRVIIIANTPGWFNFIWKMIRPMVNETTQKKIRIVGVSQSSCANRPSAFCGHVTHSTCFFLCLSVYRPEKRLPMQLLSLWIWIRCLWNTEAHSSTAMTPTAADGIARKK